MAGDKNGRRTKAMAEWCSDYAIQSLDPEEDAQERDAVMDAYEAIMGEGASEEQVSLMSQFAFDYLRGRVLPMAGEWDPKERRDILLGLEETGFLPTPPLDGASPNLTQARALLAEEPEETRPRLAVQLCARNVRLFDALEPIIEATPEQPAPRP